MTRGQAEGTFSWIFVLLAGGAMLVMFFLLIRGCSEAGEESRDRAGAEQAADLIAEHAFGPEGAKDVVLAPLSVMCVEGSLYIVGESSRAALGPGAAFLPPSLGDGLHLRSIPIGLQADKVPPIPLGSAVFGIDDDAYYVMILGSQGAHEGFVGLFGSLPNVRRIAIDDITDPRKVAALIPASAARAVFVSTADAGYLTSLDVSGLPQAIEAVGVLASGDRVTFFGGRPLAEIGRADAEHEILRIGAIVTADPGLYACSRAGIEQRAHHLTELYASRSTILAASMTNTCSEMHGQVAERLEQINEEGAYLAALFASERYLAGMQNGLMQRSCPVIA